MIRSVRSLNHMILENACMDVYEWVFFLGRGKCFMHRRYYVPVCRTVPNDLTKTLISLLFASRCPRETIAMDYFAGASSAVQLFYIFSFLFVMGNGCCWSPHLSVLLLLFSESLHNGCGETANRRPLFLRCQGVDPSVSSTSFLSSVKR